MGRSYGKLALLIVVVLSVPLLFFCTLRFYKAISYEVNIEGYLTRAANANTIELAQKELGLALTEIERRGWTKGSTHILIPHPSNDVGFWYENLLASYDELSKVNYETSQLERTNILMKLRETLLDEGGRFVTAPPGISIFPYNVAYCFFGWISGLIALVGCLGFFVYVEYC